MPEEPTPPADLQALLARRALTEDAARPDAVARRHERGGRTARENVADLVDAGSFVEYGRFAIAAQRQRRELQDLIECTPGDGLVAGTALVDGVPTAVLSYDYTVLAGTQGAVGHLKKDRLFELIERMGLPTVFFAEGGGGRPGDTDVPVVSALHVRAFALWARLSGKVPRIAVVKGRCFAGNAVIAGCVYLGLMLVLARLVAEAGIPFVQWPFVWTPASIIFSGTRPRCAPWSPSASGVPTRCSRSSRRSATPAR